MNVDRAFDLALEQRRPDVASLIYELQKHGRYPLGCDNFDLLMEQVPGFNQAAEDLLRSIENAERNRTPI